MARKWFPDDPDNLVRDYLGGVPIRTLALRYGVTRWPVARALQDLGVTLLSGPETIRRRQWLPPDSEGLARRYLGGERLPTLGIRYGVDRATIKRALLHLGVPIRSRSEDALLRMAELTEEQRRALPQKAQAATRGRKAGPEELHRRAVTKQRILLKVGRLEEDIRRGLLLRGYDFTQQAPVGAYNIDLARLPVAVEIYSTPGNPFRSDAVCRRTVYLLERGIHVLLVRARPGEGMSDLAYEYLIAFIQETERHPSPQGRYRMIGSSGEYAITGCGDLNDFPVVPSPRDPQWISPEGDAGTAQ